MKDRFPAELVETLRRARRIAVLTGAGISAESGVPTFRDALTGLWARFNPHELATSEAFAANPKLVWEWYSWRRSLINQARPNPAHYAVTAMAAKIPSLTLITQNVDGLHQRAGSPSVIELHGNIHVARCTRENVRFETWDEALSPPACPRCGAHLRPDVVWFGENLPRLALEAAERLAGDCDVFFSIGTSSEVYPAAALPELAKEHGSYLVEINPQRTQLSAHADCHLSVRAGEALPALIQACWPSASTDTITRS